jgi:hypothetical protein
MIMRFACCLALTGLAWSQVPLPSFEVATIKRSDPTSEDGQMIHDPRLVALAHVSLQNLLAQAYESRIFRSPDLAGSIPTDSISWQGFLTEPRRISFRGCSRDCSRTVSGFRFTRNREQ